MLDLDPSVSSASARAAELAAAVLASRRSDPAVRGRILVKRSPRRAPSGQPPPPARAPMARAGSPGVASEGLRRHAHLSLVSKVCSELEAHRGIVDRDLGRRSPSVAEFGPKLRVHDFEVPDCLARTLHTVFRASSEEEGDGDPELHRAAAMAPLPAASAPLSDGQLGSDPAVVVAGLGSLLLPPAASGGPVCAEVRSVEGDDGTISVVSSSAPGNDVRHVEEAPAEPCVGLSAAAAPGDEEGRVQVGRGGRPDRAPSSPYWDEGLDRGLAFKRWARGRCFRCLEHGHQVSTCRGPFRCIRCNRPGHRERFCRARSPVARDRSPAARACSQVTRAPNKRSRSPSVQTCPPTHVSVPPRSPAGCSKDSHDEAFLDSAFESQLALLRMEFLQKVELLRCELHDALAKLQATSVVALPAEFQIGSVDEGTKCFFGEFSPRALHATSSVLENVVISEVVAPVVEMLPELQDPCGESPMVLPIELGSVESSVVDMAPAPPPSESCQLASSVDSGGLIASGTLCSLSDQVDDAAMLASNSEALFGKEICDLLVNLEAACPGYGKDIACVLAGTASDSVCMKVEKSLRSRARKKLGVARKTSAFS